MLDRSQTFHEVRGLLERLAGVAVRSDRLVDDVAEFDLIIASGASLTALQRSCLGANVGITPWTKLSAAEQQAEAISPRECTLSARAYAVDEKIPCGYLQLLGIHLVWVLHRGGDLSADQASELLHAWNGAPVPR